MTLWEKVPNWIHFKHTTCKSTLFADRCPIKFTNLFLLFQSSRFWQQKAMCGVLGSPLGAVKWGKLFRRNVFQTQGLSSSEKWQYWSFAQMLKMTLYLLLTHGLLWSCKRLPLWVRSGFLQQKPFREKVKVVGWVYKLVTNIRPLCHIPYRQCPVIWSNSDHIHNLACC